MKMRKLFDVMQREKWKTNVYNLLTLLEIRVFLFRDISNSKHSNKELYSGQKQ